MAATHPKQDPNELIKRVHFFENALQFEQVAQRLGHFPHMHVQRIYPFPKAHFLFVPLHIVVVPKMTSA